MHIKVILYACKNHLILNNMKNLAVIYFKHLLSYTYECVICMCFKLALVNYNFKEIREIGRRKFYILADFFVILYIFLFSLQLYFNLSYYIFIIYSSDQLVYLRWLIFLFVQLWRLSPFKLHHPIFVYGTNIIQIIFYILFLKSLSSF